MSYLEELLPEFRNGAKIRCKYWASDMFVQNIDEDDIDIEDLLRNDWEFYREPIDWDYIIKNKCLCWFWNSDNDNKEYGLLGKIYDNLSKGDYRFYKKFEQHFKHCCPVRRDEVNFYEDKKDD